MSAPLYRGVNAPAAPARCAHKGLWFERFFNQYDGDFAIPSDGKKTWINKVAAQGGDTAQLNKATDRQANLCFALGGQSKVFKTDWHFATGLGNSHPVENGFAWHPTLGVPYLTGAAVKGLVRAWMEEWHDFGNDDPKKTVKDWFGSAHKADVDTHAGAFIFFDAIPLAPVTLACDVMTPHYGKWYESGGDLKADPTRAEVVPADWHDPVPVPFLVVKRGSFLFSVAPRDTKDKDEIVAVMVALQNALEWLGAGAKTAAGYGRFDEDETENGNLSTRASEVELAAKAAAKLAARRDELDKMQPFEKGIYEKADARIDKVQSELSFVLNLVKSGEWNGREKLRAAEWLAQKMKAAKGEWRERSEKKKTDKDREYQNTLLVKSWLSGK